MRTAFASCGANVRKHNNKDNNNKSTFAFEIDFGKVRELKFMTFEYTKKTVLNSNTKNTNLIKYFLIPNMTILLMKI